MRQTHFLAAGLADQVDGLCEHRHHAEAEQIDLHDAHVGAIVLVPLHDDAAGHAGVLERHDGIELARNTTMPPECWPRCRGRSCMPQDRRGTRGYAIFEVEADRGRAPALSVGYFRLKVHHPREPRSTLVEPSTLPDLARRAPAAIRDDVGGHRRAELAVFFVDVLDDALAAIAARQIEIDVRPLAALLRQKPLEQQIHADRIDRRDAEAVAHGAVGRRPAALHEDVVLPAELDDVPDDAGSSRRDRASR